MNLVQITERRAAEAVAQSCMARSGWKRLALSRLFEASLQPWQKLVARQPGPPGEEPRTILVVEYWHLGDHVMLTPFLKSLRRHYPRTRIALFANPKVLPLIEGMNLVDEVIPVRVPWSQHDSRRRKYISRHWAEFFRCLGDLRRRNFDWGFSARADVRDNFILWAGGVKRRIGYGYGHGASLLTDVVTPEIARPHFSDRWLHLLEYLEKPTLDRQPELKVSAVEQRAAQDHLANLGIGGSELLIGVHAGARNPIRQWGEENFFRAAQELARKFPIKVLWFEDPGAARSKNNAEPWLVPITMPLREFLAVLTRCRLLLCNDTGPMHLATAMGVPVVAVFGATMPAWWGPRREGSQVVLHEGVWCRPCGDRCHFDEPYCLRAVSVDRVVDSAEATLAKLILRNSPEAEARQMMAQPIQGN